MKKIYYLLLVGAVLALVGCTTDVPEEKNAPLSDTTTLSVDIAKSATKVALGDKANGVYAVCWSEGDRISVNGYISEEAEINTANASSARFKIKGASLEYPYNILYPASESDVVNFPAIQNYKEGTFDVGASPMYARVESSGEGVSLHHLGGVLRLAVIGDVENMALSKMVVESAEGVVAGDFAVNFEEGTIAPTATAVSTLEYRFGEGLTLSTTEAKEFFVVLPYGEFGLCSAEIHTTDGRVMYVKFNTSGDSAIKAGVVREFAAVTFKNGQTYTLQPYEVEEDELIIDTSLYMKTPTTVDGDYLVVKDMGEFMWLCNNKPLLNGVTYNKIRIGADIDMGALSNLRMPSMQLADGAEIDGNNKIITGVNMNDEASSIFGDINNLKVYNLTFTNCSVNTTVQTGAALLAGVVSEGITVNNVTFNNCSVVAPCKIGMVAGALHTGTFDVSSVVVNGGMVETSYLSGKSGLAGGLVGCIAKNGDGETASTATFSNCRVSATIKSYMESADYFYGKMVGQIGGYNSNEKLYFESCDGSAATLVPLYDQGAKYAEKALLTYCEAHRADFCSTTLSAAQDNLLGGERYCRGEVCYEGNRFYAKWDGIRSVTMLTDTVEGVTRSLVYSPYDLAKAQAAKFSATKALTFMSDVDMGGHKFTPIEYVINLDGQNHSLYNLKVDIVHNAAKNYGAGFIVYANNAATHKDLTFVGADVNCSHDTSIAPLAYGDTEDGGAGNAYAGILVSRSWRTAIKDDAGATTGYTDYNVSNIHIRDSKVRGVCKVGGLIGACRGQVYIDNCSVDNSIIENYDPKVVNYYTMKKSVSASLLGNYVVEGLQWWYTAGECGGLIGFLEAHYAEITNCAVTNTQINCTGQPNKEVVANVWKAADFVEGAYKSGASVTTRANTTIAGRHINQFIGNIRSRRSETQQEKGTGEYTNKIIDYTVSGNSYNGVAAESTNEYNHNYASGKYCDAVGCAYYTGVDMSLIITTIHVSECAGTLIFQPKGGAQTTLTEAIGKGNNMDWFGGDGKMTTGKSYYPEAPAN